MRGGLKSNRVKTLVKSIRGILTVTALICAIFLIPSTAITGDGGRFFTWKGTFLLQSPSETGKKVLFIPAGMSLRPIEKKGGYVKVHFGLGSGWIPQDTLVEGKSLFVLTRAVIPQKEKKLSENTCGTFGPGYPGILIKQEEKWIYVKLLYLTLFKDRTFEGWIPENYVHDDKELLDTAIGLHATLENYLETSNEGLLNLFEGMLKDAIQRFELYRRQKDDLESFLKDLKNGTFKDVLNK